MLGGTDQLPDAACDWPATALLLLLLLLCTVLLLLLLRTVLLLLLLCTVWSRARQSTRPAHRPAPAAAAPKLLHHMQGGAPAVSAAMGPGTCNAFDSLRAPHQGRHPPTHPPTHPHHCPHLPPPASPSPRSLSTSCPRISSSSSSPSSSSSSSVRSAANASKQGQSRVRGTRQVASLLLCWWRLSAWRPPDWLTSECQGHSRWLTAREPSTPSIAAIQQRAQPQGQ